MTWFAKGRGKYCPFRLLITLTRKSALSLSNHKPRHDTISHNKFAKLTIIGTMVTVALYLVPHSIMISPAFSIFLFGLLIVIFLVPEQKREMHKFIEIDKLETTV